jgi:hypothetical protein
LADGPQTLFGKKGPTDEQKVGRNVHLGKIGRESLLKGRRARRQALSGRRVQRFNGNTGRPESSGEMELMSLAVGIRHAGGKGGPTSDGYVSKIGPFAPSLLKAVQADCHRARPCCICERALLICETSKSHPTTTIACTCPIGTRRLRRTCRSRIRGAPPSSFESKVGKAVCRLIDGGIQESRCKELCRGRSNRHTIGASPWQAVRSDRLET